jgi:CubicO group peptidase (beta-lactamase class C family)
VDEQALPCTVVGVLDRWPSAGLAAGVVHDGALAWLLGHGVANVRAGTPITQDTVFRIGSVTKTMTAIAVLQLWEQGLVELDAPARDALRAFELVPAKATFRPVTIRHLLTHTSGIGYWRRWSDLLRPGVGSGDYARRPVDSSYWQVLWTGTRAASLGQAAWALMVLRSCRWPSMKVAPARTSATSSGPLIRRQRVWAASSSL